MKRDILEEKQITEIHIIPYSHNDYAWTNTRQWHICRYVLSLSEVLDAMRKNSDFTWLIDNVVHSLVPFLKYCPEKFEELKMRIQEGRIGVANGGVSLITPTNSGEETFIRNMVVGKKFFENTFEIGNIDSFFNADTTSGYSQLPQVFSLAEHKFYKFFRPEEALNGRKVPKQFIWKGLDGSTVLVSRSDYFGFKNAKYTNDDFDKNWDAIREEFCKQEIEVKLELLPTGVVCLFDGTDDVRPLLNTKDEPINLLGFVEEWNKREKVKLMFSNLDNYFKSLENHKLSVHEGVLDQCEMSFYIPFKGNYSLWRITNALDHLIVKAESLAAITAILGKKYPQEEITSMWNDLFELTGHAMEYGFEKDTNELISLGNSIDYRANAIIKRMCEVIALMTQVESGEQYVMFNILNWVRKEPVRLHITSAYGVSGFDLINSKGNRIDYQVIEVYDGDKCYLGYEHNSVDIVAVVEVPAMGYETLRVVRLGTSIDSREDMAFVKLRKASVSAANDTFIVNNDCFEIIFEKGGIKQIKDIKTGKYLNSKQSNNAFNKLRFVHTRAAEHFFPGSETVRESNFVPESWDLVENGPVRWIYRVTGNIDDTTIIQDIIIKKDQRVIDFSLDMECKGGDGYFAADFASDAGTQIFASIPFGVEKRELSFEAYTRIEESKTHYNQLERGIKGLYYAFNWTMFTKECFPVSIISDNCSLFYLHDDMKDMISIIFHRTIPLNTKKDWAINCHPYIEGKGRHNFKYSFYIGDNTTTYTNIEKYSKEKSQSVEVTPKFSLFSKNNIELNASFVQTDSQNVIISAFYKENEKFILRLFENEGISTDLNIYLPFAFKDAKFVNFIGNVLEGINFNVDYSIRTVSVSVNPWQIINLEFVLQEE